MSWKFIGNIKGPKGKQGPPGRSIRGAPGVGERGLVGPFPRHEWDQSRVRFEIAPGKWGEWADLRGEKGDQVPFGPRVLSGGGGVRTEVVTITEPAPPASSGTQYVSFLEHAGPSSYAAGGFEIDLTATYTTLASLDLSVKTVGNLPVVHCEIALDSPSAGKATVKLMRHRYDRTSATGNVSGEPAGVTVRAASGGVASDESSHTHAIDHDHGSFSSGVNQNNGGGQTLLDALGPNLAAHTHTLDLPSLAATSGAGSAHNHTDNSLYQHQHAAAHTGTNQAAVEVANATNLSTTVWYVCATGTAA